MVQAIENWSCVTGRVVADPEPSATRKEPASRHAFLAIVVDEVSAVAGYANLLADRRGKTIRVRLRPEQAAGARRLEGKRIVMPVAVAGPGVLVAHTEWTPNSGSPLCR